MQIDPELIEYISECKKRGFNSESIESALLRQGHPKGTVEKAFDIYLKKGKTPLQQVVDREKLLNSPRAVMIVGVIIFIVFLSAFATNSYLIKKYPRSPAGLSGLVILETTNAIKDIHTLHNTLEQKQNLLSLEIYQLTQLAANNAPEKDIQPYLKSISRLERDIQSLMEKEKEILESIR